VAELWTTELGLVPYAEACKLQLELRERVQGGELPDLLLLLEHPPVYTRGRRSQPGELPMGEDWYRMQGIEVLDTDRGGRLTYHGPGQLVAYPIMRVADVVDYLRRMERAIVAALADEGISAQVREGLTGVWVGERKIGSIGVHLSRGVTTHGFAVNVANDLQPFEWAVPCGLEGVRMTSVAAETGRPDAIASFRRQAALRFAEAVQRRQRLVSPQRLLGRAAPEPAAVGA